MSNTQLIVSPRLKNKVDKYVRYVNIVDVLLWRTQDFPDYGANLTDLNFPGNEIELGAAFKNLSL